MNEQVRAFKRAVRGALLALLAYASAAPLLAAPAHAAPTSSTPAAGTHRVPRVSNGTPLRTVSIGTVSPIEFRRRLRTEPSGTLLFAAGHWFRMGSSARSAVRVSSARAKLAPSLRGTDLPRVPASVVPAVVKLPDDPNGSWRQDLSICTDTICASFHPVYYVGEVQPDVGQVHGVPIGSLPGDTVACRQAAAVAQHLGDVRICFCNNDKICLTHFVGSDPKECFLKVSEEDSESRYVQYPCAGETIKVAAGGCDGQGTDCETSDTYSYSRTFALAKGFVFDHLEGSPDCTWYSAAATQKAALGRVTLTVSITDGSKLAQDRKRNVDGNSLSTILEAPVTEQLQCALDAYVIGPKGASPVNP